MRFMTAVAGALMAVFTAGGVFAQGALPIQVNLDHAVFSYDQERALLEVYMAFEARTLTYDRDSLGYRARLPIDITVVRSTEATLEGTPTAPVWEDSLALSFVLPDTSALQAGQHFIHQVRAPLPPGEYELHLTIPEHDARPRMELRRDVTVPGFDAGAAGLSDLTLASTIQVSENRDDLFYKNGLLVRPNANQLYGLGLPVLYWYGESYHADAVAGDDSTYTLFSYIAQANQPQPLAGLQRRTTREARSPDVLFGAFDLSGLPSGSYFLRVAVLNENNESVVEQARKFFVYNPGVAREAPPPMEESFETSPYATMNEEEVDRAFEHIGVVSNDREKRRLRSIRDLDERRRFLMEFWNRRDPDPSSPLNEFKEEFYRRLQYANERYASSFEEGWKSDRGRTIIKYGMPTAVEPHLYDRETLPHEIWQYNNIPGEGQAVFVFADRTGFGRFELIHSTVLGERKLPEWQQELKR